MPPIKLVAIDLDDTLLNGNRQISPANRKAVASAIERGIIVVLASGRIGWSVKNYQRDLGIDHFPMISTNGCQVDGWDGAHLVEAWLNPDIRHQVLNLADEHGLHVNGYTPKELYFTQNGSFAKLYRSRVAEAKPVVVSTEKLAQTDVLKLLFIAHPPKLDEMEEVFAPAAASKLCSMTRSEPEYLEFLPTGRSKGSALEELCRHLGIEQAETAAIGDYYNDREMLLWVSTPAVPSNAPDDLKSLVGRVVADHDDDGVAEFLDSL